MADATQVKEKLYLGLPLLESKARNPSNPRVSGGRSRGKLFPSGGICYNHRAVEHAAKQGVVPVNSAPTEAVRGVTTSTKQDCQVDAGMDDASRYCPVCSQRLESRHCKLICPVCGYFMSCADYY